MFQVKKKSELGVSKVESFEGLYVRAHSTFSLEIPKYTSCPQKNNELLSPSSDSVPTHSKAKIKNIF